MKQLLLTLLVIGVCHLSIGQTAKKKAKASSFTADVPADYSKNTIVINYFGSEAMLGHYDPGYKKAAELEVSNGKIKWARKSAEPVYFYSHDLLKANRVSFPILEPGDKVVLKYVNGKPQYSGRGSEKFTLGERLGVIHDSIEALPKYAGVSIRNAMPKSVEDYLLWCEMQNRKLEFMIPVMDAYKSKISSVAYNQIKARAIGEVEKDRLDKFFSLRGQNSKLEYEKNANGEKLNTLGLTEKDMARIYDSTLNTVGSRYLFNESPIVREHGYYMMKLRMDINRKLGNFFSPDSVTKKTLTRRDPGYWVTLANMAKEKLTGPRRESILAAMLMDIRGAMYYVGFTPEINGLLKDYYSQSTSPAYAAVVKKKELADREKRSKRNGADFELADTKGSTYSSEKIAGKVALLDFWFTGCKGCVGMTPALKIVENAFREDTNVVFLSISVDRNAEQWKKSIAEGKYTTGHGYNLYTGGKGQSHEMITTYGVTGYPSLYLIDALGRLTWYKQLPDPRNDDGKEMIQLIKQKLALMKDGPYVYHTDKGSTAYSFAGDNLSRASTSRGQQIKLSTDIDGVSYMTTLRQSIKSPAVEYPKAEKLLAFSDIEGNFDALRKLLQANGVIDQQFNWTFGNGHIVFAGDMFDRGLQVTECLWLMYALEQKAEAAGGFVHFILGNHELMNLKGQDSYVQNKYKKNADILSATPASLYGPETELGRWLRSKNVIEKIGDLLFVHAGISPQVNGLNLSVQEINDLLRPYYGSMVTEHSDPKLNILLSDRYSPHWYRGYYKSTFREKTLDSTLEHFGVKHIMTGHSIVSDTVSLHYNNKVINTDTRHDKGRGEALLIERDHYYRVNDKGDKVLLFIDRQRRAF